MKPAQLPEAGRAGRFSSASARNRGGGLLAPPPRVQAREAQKLRSDFFLVRISKSNLWGEGGRKRERGEEDGSLHPSLHPTLRKGELLSLSAERVQATSLTFGRSAGRHYSVGSFSGLLLRECRWSIQRDRLAGSFILTFPTKPQPSYNHPLAREMREQLVTTGIRGRTSCACSYGGVARVLHAANEFVLFTGRRTRFIMITGGCSNYINQN